jgi:hypothetical protein
LKPFEYIDLVEIFCRDDPRFRAEWLYLMTFIKPVVKIPAHSGHGIHFGELVRVVRVKISGHQLSCLERRLLAQSGPSDRRDEMFHVEVPA